MRSPKAAKNFKKLAKLPKLGSGAGRAGLMAFGGIGLAAYLMTEAIPGGHCGGDMAGEYTHQTRAFIGSCSLEPALDANTLEFLDLTQEQQEKLLNHHGKICRYYELLHKKLFSNYKLKTLSCSGRDTIVTYSLEGSSETKRLKIRAGKNGHIYSLNWENLKSGGSPSMSIPKHVKLDPSHKPETAVNSFISEDYNMAKLFAGEAVRCCNSTEDDLCNQNFPENQSQKSKKSNSTYVN